MANFEAFRRVISSNINLLFLKSETMAAKLTQCARKKVPTQDIKITFLDDFFTDARDGCLVHFEQKKNFIAHLAGHGGRFKSNFGTKWPFWTLKKTPYS